MVPRKPADSDRPANRPVYLAIGIDCEGAKQVRH
jgi:transposase-like protein